MGCISLLFISSPLESVISFASKVCLQPIYNTSFQPQYYHLLTEEHKSLYLYSLKFSLVTVTLRWVHIVQITRASHLLGLLSPARSGSAPSVPWTPFIYSDPIIWPPFYSLNMPSSCLSLGLCTYHSPACSSFSQIFSELTSTAILFSFQLQYHPNYSVEFIYHHTLTQSVPFSSYKLSEIILVINLFMVSSTQPYRHPETSIPDPLIHSSVSSA